MHGSTLINRVIRRVVSMTPHILNQPSHACNQEQNSHVRFMTKTYNAGDLGYDQGLKRSHDRSARDCALDRFVGASFLSCCFATSLPMSSSLFFSKYQHFLPTLHKQTSKFFKCISFLQRPISIIISKNRVIVQYNAL